MGLLFKLAKMRVHGSLLRWIRSFLANRSIRVQHEGVISEARIIPIGVPQGAVLSPILFNVMLSDFPLLLNDNTNLFADDIQAHIQAPNSASAETSLQAYLNDIENWAVQWGFAFSGSKSTAVTFTRKRKPEPDLYLILSGQRIPCQVSWGSLR